MFLVPSPAALTGIGKPFTNICGMNAYKWVRFTDSFKAPLKNSIRLGNKSRQSCLYGKFVSKSLICKLVFGTSNIIHGRWDLRPALNHLFGPKIHLKLGLRSETVLFMGEKNTVQSERPAANWPPDGKGAPLHPSRPPIPLAALDLQLQSHFWWAGRNVRSSMKWGLLSRTGIGQREGEGERNEQCKWHQQGGKGLGPPTTEPEGLWPAGRDDSWHTAHAESQTTSLRVWCHQDTSHSTVLFAESPTDVKHNGLSRCRSFLFVIY